MYHLIMLSYYSRDGNNNHKHNLKQINLLLVRYLIKINKTTIKLYKTIINLQLLFKYQLKDPQLHLIQEYKNLNLRVE